MAPTIDEDDEAFERAAADLAAAHHALQAAEAAYEAMRDLHPAYRALEVAERELADADAAFWASGESTHLLGPRLEARASVAAARRVYHDARDAMPERAAVVAAADALAAATRTRDEAWRPFSRTAARLAATQRVELTANHDLARDDDEFPKHVPGRPRSLDVDATERSLRARVPPRGSAR